jgi:hypothetical protein
VEVRVGGEAVFEHRQTRASVQKAHAQSVSVKRHSGG